MPTERITVSASASNQEWQPSGNRVYRSIHLAIVSKPASGTLTVDAATEPSPGQSYSYIASISRDLATDADEFLLNWAAGANPAIAALRFTNSEATPIVIEASLNDRQ